MYYYKFIYITKFSNNTAFAIPDLHIFLDAILEVEIPHLRALDGYHHHMFQCVLLERNKFFSDFFQSTKMI